MMEKQQNKKIQKLGRPIQKKRSKKHKNNNSQDQSNQSQSVITDFLTGTKFQESKNKFNNVIGQFMSFFQDINFKNGFIFSKKNRIKLRKQNTKIQWKQETFWDQQREQKKLIPLLVDLECSEKEKNFFIKMCIHVSCIFDEQSTVQLFTLLKKIWVICSKNSQKSQQLIALYNNIISNENNLYPFFSFHFSSNYQINPTSYKKGVQQLINNLVNIFTQFQQKLSSNENTIR